MSQVQWYPGHIAKWDKQLLESLKQADVVLEVLDARFPESTRHPQLAERLQAKPRLLLLNKWELADPDRANAWINYWSSKGEVAMSFDAHQSKREPLLKKIAKLGAPVQEKWIKKGLKKRPVRVLIVGMPNVGKSSLLNRIVGRKKVQTGHKAGVTRESKWIRVHPEVDLLDSPGIIPPKLDSEQIGFKLASVSAIGEAAFDAEAAAQHLLELMNEHYPGKLHKFYGLEEHESLSLEGIARARNFIGKGEVLEIKRTAQHVLKQFRQSSWGRLCLERPPSSSPSDSETEASTE